MNPQQTYILKKNKKTMTLTHTKQKKPGKTWVNQTEYAYVHTYMLSRNLIFSTCTDSGTKLSIWTKSSICFKKQN